MKKLAALLMILCAGFYVVGCTPADDAAVPEGNGDVTAPPVDAQPQPTETTPTEPEMEQPAEPGAEIPAEPTPEAGSETPQE